MMKDVKRYTASMGGGQEPDGCFVMYEDYAAIKAERDALAAECSLLKNAVTEMQSLREEIRKAGTPPHSDFWHQSLYMAEQKIEAALKTPATDAFLLNVQADAIDKFADNQKEMALNSHGDLRHAYVGSVKDAISFSHSLRAQAEALKGGE